ncbi:dihydrodipicolinate synthase family protein [Egibacter rhizosphaerae]|uniref:Dihydrodipicolinate synthase family protein n=1 Tax=Egibacter rhizosphaerae TaxID=1670831 RepID=A0A411YHX2_9ACTN|nr:dihydrodipicolinate synthase family protein [Egibacter rhizosphaerae]QBI20716.1 dihydrodipicolinate synthase family protein [Egibacter rhizosphaerae]
MHDGLAGVHVAALTPFARDRDRSVATDAYLAHLRWLASHGVDGIVCFGTNGEGPSLSVDEKARLFERLHDEEWPVTLIPTVGEVSLTAALELIRHYNEFPSPAVMVSPPHYFKQIEPGGLRDYYERVLAESAHPVIAYHIPSHAIAVPPEVIGDLPLWGVKDSGGDLAYAEDVLQRGRGVLLGAEPLAWDGLRKGATGLISGLANAVPDRVVALAGAVAEGDEATAKALQVHLAEFRSIVSRNGGPAALKRLAEHRHGHSMGTLRPPLVDAPADLDPEAALAVAAAVSPA